jgi:hypothetical protein
MQKMSTLYLRIKRSLAVIWRNLRNGAKDQRTKKMMKSRLDNMENGLGRMGDGEWDFTPRVWSSDSLVAIDCYIQNMCVRVLKPITLEIREREASKIGLNEKANN